MAILNAVLYKWKLDPKSFMAYHNGQCVKSEYKNIVALYKQVSLKFENEDRIYNRSNHVHYATIFNIYSP